MRKGIKRTGLGNITLYEHGIAFTPVSRAVAAVVRPPWPPPLGSAGPYRSEVAALAASTAAVLRHALRQHIDSNHRLYTSKNRLLGPKFVLATMS